MSSMMMKMRRMRAHGDGDGDAAGTDRNEASHAHDDGGDARVQPWQKPLGGERRGGPS